MGEFSDMFRRIKLNNIISYLIYGIEDYEIENKGTYEERIEKAFHKIFESLEKMNSSFNKENDELQSLIIDLSITHNEVYLEMGILLGIQMYRNLEQQNFAWNNIQAIIDRNISVKERNNR